MNMRNLFFFLLFLPVVLFAQRTDTLTFYSEAFEAERTVYIKKPDFFDYRSKKLEVPVIYVLDGQHKWFADPMVNDIEFLQFTHELPFALVVVIPHEDRAKECGGIDLEAAPKPLHRFIVGDLESELKAYGVGDFRLIIGHSFTASFALYSFLMGKGFYSAVVAHSPLDHMKSLVPALSELPDDGKNYVAISIGSIDSDKDYFHRVVYDEMKEKYPDFFDSIFTYEANEATHNSVPIVANPILLSKLFYPFSRRFSHLAQVDMEYKLKEAPERVEDEMRRIDEASVLGDYYPPELDEINGLASRYWNSDYTDHARAVYEKGIQFYPFYFEFYIQLYQLAESEEEAKAYLLKAREMVLQWEMDSDDGSEILNEIDAELSDRGWKE